MEKNKMAEEYKEDVIRRVTSEDHTSVTGLTRICVYKAILNGMTYRKILYALRNDEFGIGRKLSKVGAEKLISSVYAEVRETFKQDKTALLEAQYERLMDIYEDSRNSKDRLNAISALKEINKMTGLYEPNKMDINIDGYLEIDFDMNRKENETEN